MNRFTLQRSKEYGKRIKLLSQTYLTKHTRQFFNCNWTEEDMKMLFSDAADLAMIGQYLQEDNIEAAWNMASNLDTYVRDEIPNSVWSYMEDYEGRYQ